MVKGCMFCQVPLTSANKSREHVIKKKWLDRLGHLQLKINLRRFTRGVDFGSRSMVANNFLAGEVCCDCNNGWMNRLDNSVESIVLGLAIDPNPTVEARMGSLATDEKKALARWILKTACTAAFTEPVGRRHIPRSILDLAYSGADLPRGFVAYYSVCDERAGKNVAISKIDSWWGCDNTVEQIRKANQSRRLKFALQMDHVFFGCAYLDWPDAAFLLVQDYHHVIYRSGANLKYFPFETCNSIVDLNALPAQGNLVFVNQFNLTIGGLLERGRSKAQLRQIGTGFINALTARSP